MTGRPSVCGGVSVDNGLAFGKGTLRPANSRAARRSVSDVMRCQGLEPHGTASTVSTPPTRAVHRSTALRVRLRDRTGRTWVAATGCQRRTTPGRQTSSPCRRSSTWKSFGLRPWRPRRDIGARRSRCSCTRTTPWWVLWSASLRRGILVLVPFLHVGPVSNQSPPAGGQPRRPPRPRLRRERRRRRRQGQVLASEHTVGHHGHGQDAEDGRGSSSGAGRCDSEGHPAGGVGGRQGGRSARPVGVAPRTRARHPGRARRVTCLTTRSPRPRPPGTQ
jgi:hypothetical protein